MKNTGNISKILDKVREEYVSVPKYLIHNALRDAAQLSSDKFDKTMSTIINAVMIAAPSKKERVGFIIMEYCVDNNKQLIDQQYINLIDCFTSNNYYMKCMYNDPVMYEIFSDVYPTDKLRNVYKKALKNMGKTSHYKRCFSSEAKVLTFASSFFLYSKADYKDAVDMLVKEKSVGLLVKFLLEVLSNNDIYEPDNISVQIFGDGFSYWSSRRIRNIPIPEITAKDVPFDDIVRYTVKQYLTALNKQSGLLTMVDPLLKCIGYEKKVVFIDEQGNIIVGN